MNVSLTYLFELSFLKQAYDICTFQLNTRITELIHFSWLCIGLIKLISEVFKAKHSNHFTLQCCCINNFLRSRSLKSVNKKTFKNTKIMKVSINPSELWFELKFSATKILGFVVSFLIQETYFLNYCFKYAQWSHWIERLQ